MWSDKAVVTTGGDGWDREELEEGGYDCVKVLYLVVVMVSDTPPSATVVPFLMGRRCVLGLRDCTWEDLGGSTAISFFSSSSTLACERVG